jgi:phospholipid/cholesterol/gamma-HCH transport system substrate-binding protein
MNIASPEAKVGLFSITALLTLCFVFLWLNGSQLLQRGNHIEAVFDRVEGLRPGASIQLAGVDVGRVSRIYFEGRHVIVVMRINPNVQLPRWIKVIIASSGIVGDKYLDIIPCRPGEVPANSKRIMGESPVTMEQFYATAYDILNSLQTVAFSLKNFVADPEITSSLRNTVTRMDKISAELAEITAQFHNINLAETFGRINHIAMMMESLTETNGPKLNELVSNITGVSSQLAEATLTANKLLKNVDENGQTAENLKRTIASAEKITADLEKFSAILVNKQENIEQLLQDAHETMQAIKNAADSIHTVLEQMSTGNNPISQVQKTLNDTSQAVDKVNTYLASFEQVSIKNGIGVNYQPDTNLMVDYQLDLHLNPQNSLLLGLKDIGQTNQATFQWALTSPQYIARVGVYKNKFGLGLDVPLTTHLLVGLNIWDNYSPNVGIASSWEINPYWSLSLGGESNLKTNDNNWDLELWRKF